MSTELPSAGTPLDPGVLSGKRRAPRRQRTLAVECRGPRGGLTTGRTVDISRGGMLLELTDGELRAPTDPAQLVTFASRLATRFPKGMDASFGEGAVKAHATIVRLVTGTTPGAPILVGCRFHPPLEELDCSLLGLDEEGDETKDRPPEAASRAVPIRDGRDALLAFIDGAANTWEETGPVTDRFIQKPAAPDLAPLSVDDVDSAKADGAAVEVPPAKASAATKAAAPKKNGKPAVEVGLDDEDMRLLNRRAASDAGPAAAPPFPEKGEVVAHLFPAVAPFVGPRYRARVVELRTRALVVDLTVPGGEADPFGWAAGLGSETRVVCLRDGRVLWETRAKVQRLEPGASAGAMRAVLLAERAPTPAVRRAFGLLSSTAD